MNESISLIIGADVAPTKSNNHLFDQMNNDLLDNELKELWLNADFRLFNLESPITDKESPIEKCGPGLRASTKTINGIRALEPSLVLLANNHIMDQGIQGLKSTITLLEKNNIPFIGVGKNINQIKHSYVIEKNGIKIAIYNCAEHEFSIATVNSYGVNPFDPFESLDHITELKDYKIFCFNGKPKALFVATDRGIHQTKFDFFDTNFNHLPFMQHYPNNKEKEITKPKGLEKMLVFAEKLTQDFKHCRADFYDINGQVYFGELTFSHFSGLEPFEPEEWDYKFGKKMVL